MDEYGVRSVAKGVLTHRGRVLLNRCRDDRYGDYYCLPGGGQEQYETLAEAVERELFEETGCRARVVRFAALYEDICDTPAARQKFPKYAHKVYHIFACELTGEEEAAPRDPDSSQLSCEWVPLEALPGTRILPEAVAAVLPGIIAGKGPFFLGSEHYELDNIL